MRDPSAGDLLRALYERYQARDWTAAAELLHPDAEVAMPATAEVLRGRDAVIGMQRDYPEPWGELTVLRVVSDRATAFAEVEVVAPAATFRNAAVWTVRDGLLHRGTEHWVTVGGDEVPPERTAHRAT